MRGLEGIIIGAASTSWWVERTRGCEKKGKMEGGGGSEMITNYTQGERMQMKSKRRAPMSLKNKNKKRIKKGSFFPPFRLEMLIRQRRKKIRPELLLPTWLKARRCSENLRKKQKRVWEEIEEFLSSFSSRDAVQPQRKCVRGDTWNNGASKVVRDRHICKKEEPSMGFCALLCGSPFPHLRDPLDFSSPSGWPSVAADWQTFFFKEINFSVKKK